MPGPAPYYGGYNPPKTSEPSWWNKMRQKLIPQAQQPTGPNRPAWWNSLANIPVGGATSPLQSTSMPAWLHPPTPQQNWGGAHATTPDIYNAQPPQPLATSSFIGGGGAAVLGANQQAIPSTIPTGSFIAGGGQYVIGPNQQGYLRDKTIGSTTFLGAGGEAVRGPDITVDSTTDSGAGGSGGYGYKKRRGRGGYNPHPYQPSQYQDKSPAWAPNAGLANWSIG